MVCPNCSTTVLVDQTFCNKCGHKLTPDTIASLGERLTSIEALLAANSKVAQTSEQKYLELQTSENIVKRVMGWTKLFVFWVGIPYAAILLLLGMIVGKGELDLRRVVTNAKESVNGVVQQARDEGLKANATAKDALNTSKQVSADILETKRRLGELKTQIESSSAQLQKLGDQIKLAQAKLDSQSQQVQHLNRQVQAISTAKAVADIHSVFPLYGQHVAQSQSDGLLDPTTKPAGVRYVDLNLSVSRPATDNSASIPSLSDESIGKAVSALRDRKYQVFLGVIYTHARTATNSQAIGMGLDPNSCGYWPDPPAQPPCIMYFNESLKGAAIEVRDLLRGVQAVPDDRVLYLDTKRLTAQKQELLKLSAVDVVIVLTDVLH